jgi:hypothetical protein
LQNHPSLILKLPSVQLYFTKTTLGFFSVFIKKYPFYLHFKFSKASHITHKLYTTKHIFHTNKYMSNLQAHKLSQTGAIKGRGGGLGVRAWGEETAGNLGEALRAGEEGGRGREGADSRGPAVRERKEGAGARGEEWAGRGPCGERREGGGGWTSGKTWARKKEREEEARERERGAGLASFFFSFPFLHSNHSNNSI